MRNSLASFAVGIAACLVGMGNVHAHEQAIGLTEVTVIAPQNGEACTPQTCRIEVAHRLSIHDAESTLMSILGARADLVGDAEAQAKFEAYVAERFKVQDGSTGEDIPLTLLGGEVERGYYWVYQETPFNAQADVWSITQGVLMDAIPRQTNRINIRRDDQVNTLVFSGDPGPQTFRFD